MLSFNNPEQVRDFLKDRNAASTPQRQELAMRTGTDSCYYLGIQWIDSAVRSGNATMPRLFSTIDPNARKFRAVWNETTKRVKRASSATWPSKLETTISPPTRDNGVEASFYTQVMEDLLAAWVQKSRLLGKARQANHRRCINADYGLMLRLMTDTRTVVRKGREVQMADQKLEVDTFHPLRLMLDSAFTDRDLRDHYEIVWHDVWTIHQLRRGFPGVEFDENTMSTVGQLTPFEQSIASLSGGNLFARYRQNSNTKGARVYQIHLKDPGGRWGVMYSAIDTADNDILCPNLDNPVSPFGGDGLPLVMLRGTERDDSPHSISDVGLGRDAQDMLNIAMTQHLRAGQMHTSNQWLVDKRWMGPNVSDEDARNMFTNAEGGIIPGKPADKSAQPPIRTASNPPSPHMMDMVAMASDALMSNMHMSNMDSGEVDKTHQSAKYVERMQGASGKVLGIRVEEDLVAYSQLCTVALGTLVKGIQQQSPSMLQMAVEQQFDDEAIGVILKADPNYPACNLTISSSSIRYRSPDEARADMMALAQTVTGDGKPALDGMSLRKGLADLDMPVMEDDRQLRQQIGFVITKVLRGEMQWVPLRLGKYNEWCLTELRRALLDKRSLMDPGAMQRIDQAIQLQVQIGLEEAIASDPALAVQQQMNQQQAAQAAADSQQQQAEEQTEEQPQQPENVQQLMDMLAGAGAS